MSILKGGVIPPFSIYEDCMSSREGPLISGCRILSPRLFLIAAITALGGLRCQTTGPEDPERVEFVFPPYEWPIGSVSSAGLDSVLIDSALTEVKSRPYVLSFLLVRRDSLVVEYYRPGLSKFNDYDIRSATKSFVSALVGIAHEDGALPNLDQPFLDLFPEYRVTGQDSRKDSITLRHLLTMRGGFDYVDGGRNSDVVSQSSDWISAFFGLPLQFSPGERFAYSSPQTHLLSAAVSRSTGKTTAEFLQTRLFDHLKI